jgi:hypothetical protein
MRGNTPQLLVGSFPQLLLVRIPRRTSSTYVVLGMNDDYVVLRMVTAYGAGAGSRSTCPRALRSTT